MTTTDEIITIESCPVCGNAHNYQFRAKRTIALGMAEDENSLTSWKFTRVFTCPITHDDFQADIIIESTPNEIIIQLEVTGIASEESEDDAKNNQGK